MAVGRSIRGVSKRPTPPVAPATPAVESVSTDTAVAKSGLRIPGIRADRKNIIVAVVIALLLALALGLYYQNLSAQRKLKALANPQEAAKVETEALVKRVAKLAALPADETPTVATVVDAEKLRAQQFFARSENGDKVLMYTKAKRAYLYRPSTNQIVEIAPIDIGKTQAAQ